MMYPVFEGLAQGIERRIAADPASATARKAFALAVARIGMRLFAPGARLAWCGVLAPFDLLAALGVDSCFVEFVGAMLSSTGTVTPSLEKAEGLGYAAEACGYHRAVMGATAQGILPRPEFLVATSAPCNGGLAVVEDLARQFGRDLFVLHIPHGEDDEAVWWLSAQLRELVRFVERRTGQRLDPGRLRAAIERTNRAREALAEVGALARLVPSPVRPRDLMNLAFVVSLLLGKEEGVALAETYRDEYRRKVEQGVPGIPDERLRLLWIQNRIQFRHGLEAMLAERYGALIVVDELNDVGWWDPIDPDDPWEGLARRMLHNPLNGEVARRIVNLQRLAREYRVDGAIHPCHWGCRQGTGARGLLANGLRAAGVPMLALEVDCVDARNFSPGQLQTRIEAFMEMLPARRGAAA